MIWHAVCRITERERGELTFYRKGKMEEHRKEREQKERGMFTELYQGKQKNRGDRKVNESSGN